VVTQSEEPKRRHRSWGWIGWPLVLAFVLYPPSIGPACWLSIKYDGATSSARVVETSYAPIDWIRGKSESLDNALQWYLRLWIADP
jgi:hypothetical protein